MNIIEVENLHKTFSTPFSRKKVTALNGLSFQIKEGGVVGFLGANGAGKTTTLKIILGLIFADKGSVRLFGEPHTDVLLRCEVGLLTERPYFYDHLTGNEFLEFCQSLFPPSKQGASIPDLLTLVGLTEAGDRPMRQYSKGMLQRIGIAQALINNPKLLILDEPMTGLDPDGRAEMYEIIGRCREKGSTVLFSTHLLSDVEALCDKVVIINQGKLVASDTVKNLVSQNSQGWEIVFRNPDTAISESIRLDSESEVQTKIDELRSKKSIIQQVQSCHPSLQDIFRKLTEPKSEARP